MQIRLTVVDPPGPPPQRGTSRDVLVTAPAGTDLAAVASALAGAVTGEGAGRDTGGAAVVLYAGAERLDPRRAVLGEPPLVDGAVLALGAPLAAEPHPELDDAPTQLHVVAGPDAGGVHLLHGGRITVGRSADADVPLDDPDVSRLHCAVTVGADGRVSVADLNSTNGTTLDGTRIGDRAVRVPAGGLLRIGESALRVAPGGPRVRVPVVADGEGCLRVAPGADTPDAGFPSAPVAGAGAGPLGPQPPSGAAADTGHAYGSASWGVADAGTAGRDGDTHAGRFGVGGETQSARRRGGLGAWARRLAGGRAEPADGASPYGEGAPAVGAPDTGVPRRPDTWPDPAALLLTALGPGPRLWERGPGHPEALAVRLGTADRSAPDGSGLLPAVPVTAALRETGALGLAGPRPRLSGLARAVLAQLAALHSPDLLEIVLISADGSRPVAERAAEWSWLGWLPHVRPNHGQDCRLLLAYDREQAAARAEELLRRVDDLTARGAGTARPHPIPAQSTGSSGARSRPGPYDTPLIPHQSQAPGTPAGPLGGPAPGTLSPAFGTPPRVPRRPSWAKDEAELGGTGFPGPYTVVVVDGDPGGAGLQEALARLAAVGPRAGVHVLCLAEVSASSASSPVARTYDAACAVTPTLRHCGAVALLSGDVAGTLQLMRVAPGGPVSPGVPATVDAVSPAWAERFARALAPLRPDGPAGAGHARVAAPLPQSARLLDELGLARATPASLMARWADAADDPAALGGRARAVLGAGPHGPVTADLVADGPHLLIEGPAGSGRTELLRALVAALAAAERPDRLGVVLIDGRDGVGTGNGRNEGLRVCVEIPHVTTHLIANDPVRMREFAQSLTAELKRRAELLGRTDFAQWHAGRAAPGRIIAQRTPPGAGDIEAPPSSTLRLRPGAAARQRAEAVPPLPRLVVVVDDLDALVSPALGAPGRPAAGSVTRALEAVAREGERLGVHLVAAAGTDGRTADSEPARRATLRIRLAAPQQGPDEPAPGRGELVHLDAPSVAFQAGRVTGRIPRTATQRPTVVPLDWHRMGDPPTRRPVRELGNGPTDLALLASAVERAARQVAATRAPSLL
ncbi:FHA domain-containing protein [Streptomyces sp. SID8366]|uniref:FHA domain-containing protein n=3 Tax=Streptomyces TaxID=1883 RepID=UPI000DB9E16A|nr:FHA domain-containing protein [Streptomyces sp. PsTaAH-130]MYU03108.1 FHA domain-containing protein [Streptomyces sp. SID8366]RAJ57016.1 FtsK/SpoIIIE family protein [Streptomyces sp. PsTaAH-130]